MFLLLAHSSIDACVCVPFVCVCVALFFLIHELVQSLNLAVSFSAQQSEEDLTLLQDIGGGCTAVMNLSTHDCNVAGTLSECIAKLSQTFNRWQSATAQNLMRPNTKIISIPITSSARYTFAWHMASAPTPTLTLNSDTVSVMTCSTTLTPDIRCVWFVCCTKESLHTFEPNFAKRCAHILVLHFSFELWLHFNNLTRFRAISHRRQSTDSLLPHRFPIVATYRIISIYMHTPYLLSASHLIYN